MDARTSTTRRSMLRTMKKQIRKKRVSQRSTLLQRKNDLLLLEWNRRKRKRRCGSQSRSNA